MCLCEKHCLFKESKIKVYPIIGFIYGIVIFIIIYGIKILNPFYVDWLLGKGDLSQHYLGWEFFRRGNWEFPIGLTNNLAHPIKTSVVFTDSIPVLAIPFKVVRNSLPDYFQYWGLWGCLCFGLQGYFSTKIFNVLNLDWLCTLLGDTFIITSPIFIYRMFMHTSLGAHWLVLISLYLFLKHRYNCENLMQMSIYWGGIGVLTAGIHFYFFPMCFLFALSDAIQCIIRQKKLKYIIPMFVYIFGAIANFGVLGGFVSKASPDASGVAEYSFNLNAFWNARGFSRILPELKQYFGDFQHEGFAYLGLGILCLIFCCITYSIIQVVRNGGKKQDIQNIILFCIGIVSILIAASPVLTFGDKILIEIPIPEKLSKLWGIFRSTGRFIWPAYYIIVFLSIKSAAKICDSIGKNFFCGKILLIFCLCIQLFDISEALMKRHQNFTNQKVYEYSNDAFWSALSQYRQFEHLCIMHTDKNLDEYIELGAIALKYGLTINGFYFARDIDGMLDNFEYLKRQEEPKSNSIYVFLPKQTELLEECMHKLRYYELEDYIIGITWLDNDGNVNDFNY